MTKIIPIFGYAILLSVLAGAPAHATDVSAIASNMTTSVEKVPGLITGVSYLLGVILGILAIIKLKEHVEAPTSIPLKDSMVRFLAGGALFALPIVFEAALKTIDTGTISGSFINTTQVNAAGTMGVAGAAAATGTDFNGILQNIITSLQNVPGLFTGMSYLLGILFAVAGILKLKDHALEPNRTELKDGVIRLLAAGSLFAIPTIFEAMYNTINNGGVPGPGGFLGAVGKELVKNITTPTEATGTFCAAGGTSTIGTAICNVFSHSSALPVFLAGIAYLFGMALGIWGILKVKEHVNAPSQVSMWEGVSRLLAGGALFSLPYVLEAVFTTISNAIGAHSNTGMSTSACATPPCGLDDMMIAFVTDIFGPLNVLLDFFGYGAGIILIMIGITRLMKSAQEGVRGPGGIGTMMTFVAGGALLSFSPMITAFTMSIFSGLAGGKTTTIPALAYTAGLTSAELTHIQTVISAIIMFVLVLGLVSFMRGIFIVRSVAEGNHQASMMAGITHLIGGALAVNLGPFLNAVQSTLGLTSYGVNFK